MIQLFKHKWTSTEGEMLDGEQHSDNFVRWCKKTSDLSRHEWKRGFVRLEAKISADEMNGKEAWPPSDVEFFAMCRPSISPNGQNSSAYLMLSDPKHPDHQQYLDSKQLSIESDEHKEKRKATGTSTLNELKGLF